MWVLGHEGIVGNETAYQLAKLGSKYPLIQPEPACSISVGVAKKVIRYWTNRDHENTGNPKQDSNRQRNSYKHPTPEKPS
jgi:hypothetical protein